MLSGLVERTLIGGFMYRVENLVFAAVSSLFLLLGYLPNVFFSNDLFRFIFSFVLIVGIGLVFWMFFTNSGKTFGFFSI